MASNDGGPAFPVPLFLREADKWDYFEHEESKGGMSLRDWFAGQALAACGDWERITETAKHCYKVADAMLEARARPTPEPEKP